MLFEWLEKTPKPYWNYTFNGKKRNPSYFFWGLTGQQIISNENQGANRLFPCGFFPLYNNKKSLSAVIWVMQKMKESKRGKETKIFKVFLEQL